MKRDIYSAKEGDKTFLLPEKDFKKAADYQELPELTIKQMGELGRGKIIQMYEGLTVPQTKEAELFVKGKLTG